MREESFIFLPGVHEKTERKLWQDGITTWDHLLDAKSVSGVSKSRLSFWKTCIRDICENPLSLRRLLGTRWAWRMYNDIMDNPRFVDIETTEYAGDITVLGVSDGDFYQAFVKGRNLDRESIAKAFDGCSCIVTFNGSSFDLPIIERNFPGLLPDVPHLDCRHICAQAGLRGGLKKIEQDLFIRRAAAIRDTDGTDAILLWYRHVMGDENALQELIDYNAADCLNLEPLLDMVIKALWQHVRHGSPLIVKAIKYD